MIVNSGEVDIIEFHRADFNDIDIVKAMKRAGHKVQWRRKKGNWEDDITWSIGADYRVLVKNSKKEGVSHE